VPLFNSRSARSNLDRSKLQVQQLELQLEQGERQLKQDIYKAYIDAVAAMQKHDADKKALSTAEKSYSFASKRYDLNLLSAFELINSQGNLQRARIQALYSKYDYVFKMKLLEYYKGQGIKLQ
ncbi:MAG: TolC family protein, partial [Chitinophagaceae bacterium]